MWPKYLLVITQVGFALAIETFYMDQYCNSEVNMEFMEIQYGRLSIDGFYNGDCNVTIESPDVQGRIHFRFEELYFDSKSDCDTTFLSVYDGRDPKVDAHIHGLRHVCGMEWPQEDYTSTGKFLTFRFVNKDPNLYNRMQLIFTAFHTGKCIPHEYACSNERCIGSEANCNGFDPCGDGSDCRLSSDTIVGIVVGVVIGTVVLGTLVFVFVKGIRKVKGKTGVTSSSVSYRPFEPTPATVLSRAKHPSYGMAHQYAVPSATYHVSTSLQADK